jgi:mono/diheme cytochrome c family protein
VPVGDPKEGREVFAKLECFTCHVVNGERFAAVPKEADAVGPELTGMGSHHPAAYFAEAIVNPNAVIVTGPGYTGSDGLSRMPDYGDVLTVRQLIDLVAYLRSLTGDHPPTPPRP